MKRKMWAVLLCFTLGMSLTSLVHAQEVSQQKGSARVAVIDIRRVVQGSLMGQKMTKEIQALQQKQLQKLQKLEGELKQLQKKYQEQAAILSQDALTELQQRIRQKAREIDRFREDAEAKIQDQVRMNLQKLESALRPIIAEYCAQKNIDIVLDTEVITFARTTVDITDDIIQLFNKKYSQGNQQ